MTDDRAAPQSESSTRSTRSALTYYALLGLHPSASPPEIRQAYRELSKLYHPDTTQLPQAIATAKFHELNEAYATLSSPDRRLLYDHKIGYSRFTVIQPPPELNSPNSTVRTVSSSAYLDPSDRPLSAGEVFAVFILALTFLACLILAITIGVTKRETLLPSQLQTLHEIGEKIELTTHPEKSVHPPSPDKVTPEKPVELSHPTLKPTPTIPIQRKLSQPTPSKTALTPKSS